MWWIVVLKLSWSLVSYLIFSNFNTVKNALAEVAYLMGTSIVLYLGFSLRLGFVGSYAALVCLNHVLLTIMSFSYTLFPSLTGSPIYAVMVGIRLFIKVRALLFLSLFPLLPVFL